MGAASGTLGPRAMHGLAKAPTGIAGLDEVTGGGLPRGRTTLLCGGPGCGKTLMAMQFLVHGILARDEPGVFVAFEESGAELAQNVTSLGWDLEALQAAGWLSVDHIRISRDEVVETGAWDLDGLIIRLGAAIDSVGAKRVVLDTVEALFGPLRDEPTLRAELRRLFRFLNDRGVTAIVTGEQGAGTLTRYGLEEYVSDCVIFLDHRIHNHASTRTLRVVKYRGSEHGADEYPFLIGHKGFSVLPASSMGLDHEASSERVSSGIAELDVMFDGGGFFRGSSVMLSGTAGTGKTTVAARFLEAGAQRGERGMLFSFEESKSQIVRNMLSVRVDLQRWIDEGMLRVVASRPAAHGLEAHLAQIYQAVEEFDPANVVVDPISGLLGEDFEIKAMISRLIDYLKQRQTTAFLNALLQTDEERPGLGISSVIDTWIDLSNLKVDGERNRGISVMKSRGMGHSSQVREFLITSEGVDIRDVYTGEHGVLMGSTRRAQEASDRLAASAHEAGLEAKRLQLTSRRSTLEAQITALSDQLESETRALASEIAAAEQGDVQMLEARETAAAVRRSTSPYNAKAATS